MKKIHLITLALACMFFLSIGCNNSGKESKTTTTTTTTTDTTTAADTIESDPSKFSDPH